MVRSALVMVLAVAAAPAAALGQSADHGYGDGFRQSFTRCMDAAEGYDGRILDCIDVEAGYQDGLLNQAYRRAMARLRPAQRIALRNSERRWLTTRFDVCIRENGEGGTMEHWLNNLCGLSQIVERTAWLNKYRR